MARKSRDFEPFVRFGLRNPPKPPEHLELELAPENYRLKLSSLPKVCPDKNFKFRMTGHRHPLEPATAPPVAVGSPGRSPENRPAYRLRGCIRRPPAAWKRR